jgi:hypothetical protein
VPRWWGWGWWGAVGPAGAVLLLEDVHGLFDDGGDVGVVAGEAKLGGVEGGGGVAAACGVADPGEGFVWGDGPVGGFAEFEEVVVVDA